MNKQLSKVLSMPPSSAAKRILTLGVSAVLAISVTACGDDGGTDDNVIDLTPDTGAEPSATTSPDGAAPSATSDGGTVPGDGGSDADPGSVPDGGDDDGSVPGIPDGGSPDGGSDAGDTGVVVPPLEDCVEANEDGCFESCAPVEQPHFLNKCTDGCFAFDNAERLPLYVNGQLPDLTE